MAKLLSFLLMLMLAVPSTANAGKIKAFLGSCLALLTGHGYSGELKGANHKIEIPQEGTFSFKGKAGTSVLVRNMGVNSNAYVSLISPKRFFLESSKIIHLGNKMRIKDLRDTNLRDLKNLQVLDAGYHPANGYEIQLSFTPENAQQLQAFREFLSDLQEILE